MRPLLALLRPLAILFGAGSSQLMIDLAQGKVPFPTDYAWLAQILIAVILAAIVLSAQWLTQQSCEEGCRERNRIKDERIEILLAMVNGETRRTEEDAQSLGVVADG